MSKHTPGPWAYSTSQEGWSYTINIFQAENAAPTDGWSDVGYIIKTCSGEQQAIQHANARLIAAAPDLLEALKEVVRVFDSNPPSICDTVWVTGNSPETLYEHCRAAIAKAEAA